MRGMVAVAMASVLFGCGDDGGGAANDCGSQVEPADGYPTLGLNTCRAHVVFDDGSEMASAKGARDFGSLLSGISVESGTDSMSIVLSEFANDATADDCGTLTYNELTSASNGTLSVTVHGDNVVLWGSFESMACAIDGTECRDIRGKFSALRSPPERCDTCEPSVPGPTECVASYCTAPDQCERVVCTSQSSVCMALGPVP